MSYSTWKLNVRINLQERFPPVIWLISPTLLPSLTQFSFLLHQLVLWIFPVKLLLKSSLGAIVLDGSHIPVRRRIKETRPISFLFCPCIHSGIIVAWLHKYVWKVQEMRKERGKAFFLIFLLKLYFQEGGISLQHCCVLKGHSQISTQTSFLHHPPPYTQQGIWPSC